MSSRGTVVQVENLRKTFVSQSQGHRKVRALNGINLEVYAGEVLGILGPNGAGKTTFLNTLSMLLVPDEGRIRMLGMELNKKNSPRLRSMINMSSGHPNFPWSLTIEENLRFYGRLYGLSGQALKAKVERLIEMFGLNDFARQRFDELSSGTKQKLSLAKAMLNDPKILFLDEPTVGLDPDMAIKTRQIIADIARDSTVTILLTTHNMFEAEGLCRRIAFIKQGQILRLGTPQDLKQLEGKKDLEEVFLELARRPVAAGEKSLALEGGQWASHPEDEKPTPSPSASTGGLQRWVNRTLAFAFRNFVFAWRNIFAFVELVFWPIVSLISIGLMGNFLQAGENALAFVITGAIAAGVLQVTQLDVAYSLLYEVWSKSMKHTFLTPVGTSEYLIGSWLIGVVRGVVIFAILGVAAIVMFGFKFPPLVVVAVFLVGIFMSAFLMGLLVTALILTFGQKAEITAWMFAYLFMLLCGIYYPIETLPQFFKILAAWVPITYFLEYFRQSFGFAPSISHGLAKGFGLIILYLILGLNMIAAAFQMARRNGTIVRLSE